MISRTTLAALVFIPVFIFAITPLYAQEEKDKTLDLHLHRNVGFGLAGLMQGTFSIQVDAPDEVVQVLFLLDGQEIGSDKQTPFGIRINTGDYETGSHTFSAVGYSADGAEHASNKVTRQIVTFDSTLLFVVVIVVLAVGVRFAASYLSRRSTGSGGKIAYGYKGGAVCTNCGKPYAIHWWSPRLLGLHIDRCPHCSIWKTLRRAPLEELREAEELLSEPASDSSTEEASQSEKEVWQQKIDESRYEDR